MPDIWHRPVAVGWTVALTAAVCVLFAVRHAANDAALPVSGAHADALVRRGLASAGEAAARSVAAGAAPVVAVPGMDGLNRVHLGRGIARRLGLDEATTARIAELLLERLRIQADALAVGGDQAVTAAQADRIARRECEEVDSQIRALMAAEDWPLFSQYIGKPGLASLLEEVVARSADTLSRTEFDEMFRILGATTAPSIVYGGEDGRPGAVISADDSEVSTGVRRMPRISAETLDEVRVRLGDSRAATLRQIREDQSRGSNRFLNQGSESHSDAAIGSVVLVPSDPK